MGLMFNRFPNFLLNDNNNNNKTNVLNFFEYGIFRRLVCKYFKQYVTNPGYSIPTLFSYSWII